jgi:hypothetical protein
VCTKSKSRAWKIPGLPRTGWKSVRVRDVNPDGLPKDEVHYATCQACGHDRVRYVHTIVHPDWPGELNVGRLCVENLTGDPLNPARQEAELKRRAMARRQQRTACEAARVQWATQQWRRSAKGNAWTTYRGTHTTVFPSRFGPGWRFVVDGEFGRATYASEAAAMQASFDGAYRAAQARAQARPATRVEPRVISCPPCLVALDLPADATLDQVKAAFRRLARATHPDAGGDARDFVTLHRHYEEAVRLTTSNGKPH